MRIQWNGDLEWRIRTFFDYWRQRHTFINNLDFSKHNHEANVLLWASIDALSNLWAKNIGKEQCNNKGKRLIFDAFLAHYGGELFQVVSLPDIWNRADRKQLQLPENVCTFLGIIGSRQKLTPLDEYQLRHSSDDWKMDTIITNTLTEYPAVNITALEKCLSLSRYGAIAHKKMRSAYIHEGRSGDGSHGFELSESLTKPTYLSGIYTTPPAIGFGVKFMLHVLEECINAFEAEALTLQQDPIPAVPTT